ncbi:hypothetical protein PVAP13_2KG479005 [Panicum virgatum]|uniref:Uncharacterized protein n=1 Tax=Panicum virgatum TaxID=38727 RepID=A0A8T0WMX3_PANVG|nr:hypothetical protein PVAP13_2KG479005 [Panicum virgatum]
MGAVLPKLAALLQLEEPKRETADSSRKQEEDMASRSSERRAPADARLRPRRSRREWQGDPYVEDEEYWRKLRRDLPNDIEDSVGRFVVRLLTERKPAAAWVREIRRRDRGFDGESGRAPPQATGSGRGARMWRLQPRRRLARMHLRRSAEAGRLAT